MTARIAAFLRERIGLDAGALGSTGLETALAARRAACHCADNEEYWHHLQQSANEQQQLIEAIVVPETWFFRDAEAYGALALRARQLLLTPHRRTPLRLLSLPCATGEEPYSMAMALLDAGLTAGQFRIDAVDISSRAIDMAQRAIYGRHAFRGAPGPAAGDWRARHFTAVGAAHHPATARWAVRPGVRETVTLATGNLFDASWKTTQRRYDLIFCRNLLIYLDPQQQVEAAARLERVLAPGGALFVGPSETAVLLRRGLVSLGLPLAFAFCHAPDAVSEAAAAVPRPVPERSRERPDAPLTSPTATREITRPGLPRSERATPRTEPLRATQPVAAGPSDPTMLAPDGAQLLRRALDLANRGQAEAAVAACEQVLAVAAHNPGLAAQAWYLLGVLRDAGGDAAGATRLFRKALYLDPDHTGAMAYLAAQLELEGNLAAARILRDRAERTVLRQTS